MSSTAALTGSQAELGKDQFLQLLVSQLRAQDPLEPVKDQEFIGQLAQFSTLEGITSLNASFGELLKLQQLTQGASLLGRTVTYSVPDSTQLLTGNITSLKVNDGAISLMAGDVSIPLSRVQSVS